MGYIVVVCATEKNKGISQQEKIKQANKQKHQAIKQRNNQSDPRYEPRNYKNRLK